MCNARGYRSIRSRVALVPNGFCFMETTNHTTLRLLLPCDLLYWNFFNEGGPNKLVTYFILHLKCLEKLFYKLLKVTTYKCSSYVSQIGTNFLMPLMWILQKILYFEISFSCSKYVDLFRIILPVYAFRHTHAAAYDTQVVGTTCCERGFKFSSCLQHWKREGGYFLKVAGFTAAFIIILRLFVNSRAVFKVCTHVYLKK